MLAPKVVLLVVEPLDDVVVHQRVPELLSLKQVQEVEALGKPAHARDRGVHEARRSEAGQCVGRRRGLGEMERDSHHELGVSRILPVL